MSNLKYGIVTAVVLGAAGSALAAPITITDTTAGTATNNGAIAGGEYVGSSTGINGGFGNVIGSNSQIHVDSSSGGALNFGIQLGGGGLNNHGVIYIDSVAGGFSDTTTLEDEQDGGRAAISGDGSGTDQSEITFATGFAADFAIAFEDNFAGLFSLAAGGNNSLGFIQSVNINPNTGPAPQQREMDLTLAAISVAQGGSFRYVVTYLNSGNAFRSNEFHGVAQTTVPGGNIGQAPITLLAGDFNTFNSFVVPEPASLGLLGLAGLGFLRRRRD